MTTLYIEANNLKDSESSRIVHPDVRMQELFGTNDLTLAKVMRVIRSHLTIPEPIIQEGAEDGDQSGSGGTGGKRGQALSAVSKVTRKQKRMRGGTKKTSNSKVIGSLALMYLYKIGSTAYHNTRLCSLYDAN